MLAAQLDYIYFFFGLVLFLLGSVCLSMARAGPLPTPWWLLGAFAIAHGGAEWLQLLALAGADSRNFDVLRILVVAASFGFLLEFARRTNQIVHGSTPSPWLFLPLAAVLFSLALAFGWTPLESAVRLLVAAPAAFWTAALFFAAASRNEEFGGAPGSRRARWWGGVYFVGFGIVAGLTVPRAGFLPESWPSPAMALAWTGIPIQLVRALMVCGMALSVWALAVSFDPKGRVLRKKRVLFWVMASSIVTLVAGGWLFTDRLGRLHERDLIEDAESATAQIHDYLMLEMGGADRGALALAGLLGRFHVLANGVDPSRLDGVVDSLALASDDSVVYVLDPTGKTISTSNRDRADSFLGKNFAMRSYYQAAMSGSPGQFLGVGLVSKLPGYYASEPVRGGDGRVVAVAVVKRNLAAQLGPSGGEESFIVSADGRVVVANDKGSGVRFLWSASPGPPSGASLSAAGGRSDSPVLDHPVNGTEWVTIDGNKFIAVRLPIPGADWSLVVLKKERTRVANRFLGIVITLLLCSIVLTYFVAMQRQFGTESRITIKRREAEGRAREFARQADTDALTGLLNRLGFNGAISREFARSRRYRQPLSVVMLDLDHFKRVNDEHGHSAGDQVLASVARLLEANIRESDVVARWGGEEFVVIAPMTPAGGAIQLAEKLRALMAATPLGPSGAVTGSFGVAEMQAGDTIERLLHRADEALYRAKSGGRDRVECSDTPASESIRQEAKDTRREDHMPSKDLYAETGFGPIDQEHRALTRALEEFVKTVNAGKADGVRSALEAIIAEVVAHFGHEEALMKEFGYPQGHRHEEAHALFVGDVRRFQEELRKNGVTPDFGRWAVGRLLEWFRIHILTHDVGLGQFLRKAGAEAGSVGESGQEQRADEGVEVIVT
jgi:diguanylate cyclase (GGDEF)-like protein/hemerythrin-like metal-binding protein